MSENTLAQEQATDAATLETANQAQAARTYTQEQVDDMMGRMKGSLSKKLLKPYEDLGDPETLRSLKTEADQRAQEQQIKRGEFEKTLQDMAAKKDAEILKRDSVIKEYRVNTPLLSAAAQHRAVNAEQVRSLLNPHVRLNADGEVEVIDTQGAVRYRDTGDAMGVEDLVREFLDSNPHFVSATPATTNSHSNVSQRAVSKMDISKLDMKNPEHRALYKTYRKEQGIT